ncbi:MAG TPA: hypothetical protein VJ739_16375 [Gemmataceae bacterium]|nr:hypothetical protein [Gemmataceae bacterium]
MLRGLLLVPALLLATAAARADHFAIDLVAQAGKASQTAHAEKAGLDAVVKPRPVLEARAGQAVTVKWTLRCTDPKKTYNDVIVHFVAVKEEKAGQRTVPKLDKDVTAESALNMDFKPKDSADGQISFTLKEPGAYLLRLETIGAAVGAEGHEHFAALDLVVH